MIFCQPVLRARDIEQEGVKVLCVAVTAKHFSCNVSSSAWHVIIKLVLVSIGSDWMSAINAFSGIGMWRFIWKCHSFSDHRLDSFTMWYSNCTSLRKIISHRFTLKFILLTKFLFNFYKKELPKVKIQWIQFEFLNHNKIHSFQRFHSV